jgi:hypothetical protein
MKKLVGAFLGVLLLGVGVTGCGGTCATYCDYMVQCGPDVVEDQYGGLVSCSWDDDDDTVLDDCMASCESAYDRLSDSELEQVDMCIDCADEDLGGSCNGDDYRDAWSQHCDSECVDDDVGDWQNDLVDDWNLDNKMSCN